MLLGMSCGSTHCVTAPAVTVAAAATTGHAASSLNPATTCTIRIPHDCHHHHVCPAGLRTLIAAWLDEEWTPLEVHTRLANTAAECYARCRLAGETDVSVILLTLSSKMQEFDYKETFTNGGCMHGSAWCARRSLSSNLAVGWLMFTPVNPA